MKKTFVIVFLMVMATGTFAQTAPMDWQIGDPVVNSARASALGHAEIFGSLDGTAMFINPAWMADTHDLNVEVGVASVFGSVPFDDPVFENSGYEVKYKGSLQPEYAVASMPLRIHGFPLSLAVGVGLWTMHRPGWDTETTWGNDATGFSDILTYDGTVQMAGPGVAADLFDMIYVGITAGTTIGNTITVKDEFNDPVGTSWEETSYVPDFQVATLSAVLRPNKNFKLGAMLRPAYEMTFTDVQYKMSETDFTDNLANSIVSMPATMGASVALTSADQMIELLGEYQTRKFSEVTYGTEGYAQTGVNLDDGSALRLGLQLGALQAGYYIENIAMPEDPMDTKPATHKGFTFGFGYRGHRLSLHAFGDYGNIEHKMYINDMTSTTLKEKVWRVGGGIGIHLF